MDSPHAVIELPWPPSVNRVWRYSRKTGRAFKPPAVKSYVWLVQIACHKQKIPRKAMSDPVRILVECYPPDRRRRDLGNLDKALLDALTTVRVWRDDSQVKDQRFVSMPHGHQLAGKVVVTVWRLPGKPPTV